MPSEVYYSVFCAKCKKSFDDSRVPCLGFCSDSICSNCAKKLESADCPRCYKKDGFTEIRVNYTLREMLSEVQRLASFCEIILKKPKKYYGKCGTCEEPSEELWMCIDCALKAKVIIEDGQKHMMNLKLPNIRFASHRARTNSKCWKCVCRKNHQLISLQEFYINQKLHFEEIPSVRRTIQGLLVEKKVLLEVDYDRIVSFCMRYLPYAERFRSYLETIDTYIKTYASGSEKTELETVHEKLISVKRMWHKSCLQVIDRMNQAVITKPNLTMKDRQFMRRMLEIQEIMGEEDARDDLDVVREVQKWLGEEALLEDTRRAHEQVVQAKKELKKVKGEGEDSEIRSRLHKPLVVFEKSVIEKITCHIFFWNL